MDQQKTLLTYMKNHRGLRGYLREGFTVCLQMRLVQYIYPLTYIHKNGSLATLKKTFLTYMNKNGFLNTLFWKIFTVCLQMLSLNSHRKSKSLGFIKNISHLYEFLRGCWHPFLRQISKNIFQSSPNRTKIQRNTPMLKTFLTYIHEIAVLNTHFQKCL